MFFTPFRLPSLPTRRSRSAAAAAIALGLATVATGATGDDGQPPAASVYSRRPRTDAESEATKPTAAVATEAASGHPAAGATPAPVAAAQAERIVASSLAAIGRADSVAIKLRQRVRIGNRVLVGAGRYLQAGQGEDQRFRFETKLTCESGAFGIEPESFEVTEVSDGLFCWLHKRNGPDRPQLHRIDLQRVRGRLTELGVADPADAAPYLAGLQRSLWWIRQWFRFTEAVPAEIEGRPVWLVEGRWPPGAVGLFLPALAEADKRPGGAQPEELPDGVPWIVRLAVGRSDLLPQRLEFLAIPGPRPVAAGPVEPIMAIEFLEIQLDGPVDPTAFYYQPASEELIDLTDVVVRTIGPLRP
jgi:hypothetical protein